MEENTNTNDISGADGSGNWFLEIDPNIEPGMHTVLAEDEYGNSDTMLLYIQEPCAASDEVCVQSAPEKVYIQEPAIPKESCPWWILIILSILLVGAILLKIAERKRKKGNKAKTDKMKKRLFIFIIIIATGLAGILYFYFNAPPKETDVRKNMVNQTDRIQLQKISGRVVDPLTSTGVEGVDLTVGETSIRTDEGGRFIFNSPGDESGIRINHPELQRGVYKMFEENETMDIYFSVHLFNALVEIIDLEALDKYGIIYTKLSDEITEKISVEDFKSGYQDILELSNRSDQILVISRIELLDSYNKYDKIFRNVAEIEIVVNKKKQKYYFVNEEGVWLFIGK